MLKQIADSISYSKGYLIVKAYSLNVLDISQINSIASVVNEGDLDTSYSYGTVTITSGGKSISGTFYNGVAELKIPDSGFEFKSDDINISFSDKPIIPPHAFIARFDTSRDY